MKTYIELAEDGKKHNDFIKISNKENVSLEIILEEVKNGRIAIVPNRFDGLPVGIGNKLSSKIVCNFGTSSESPNINVEIKKARLAIQYGANIVCDQSVGKKVKKNREKIAQNINVPIASVPLYQNIDDARNIKKNPLAFSDDEVIETFEQQIKSCVSMPGIHSMTKEIVNKLNNSNRLMPLVSRGAGIMHEWIKKNNRQNPYFSNFQKIIEIVRKYNVPLTFISSLRSGTIIDGFDKYQKYEWSMLREYINIAHANKVTVLVDGVGHISIDQIPKAIKSFKKLCYDIPLGVLGPVVTDRGLGYEHIVNAIGTAIAVWQGANYCNACYRTEHLGLPQIQDIPEGIGASLIASYCGDLARPEKRDSLRANDRKISLARKKNQWGIMINNAIEKNEALKTFKRVGKENVNGKGCSICGDLCPFVITGQTKNDKFTL